MGPLRRRYVSNVTVCLVLLILLLFCYVFFYYIPSGRVEDKEKRSMDNHIGLHVRIYVRLEYNRKVKSVVYRKVVCYTSFRRAFYSTAQ